MKTKTIYETADGKTFEDEALAQQHEFAVLRETPWLILAGASAEEITDAINGENPTLADAIEATANAVIRERRERGEFKRTPRPKVSDVVAATDPESRGFDGPTGAE